MAGYCQLDKVLVSLTSPSRLFIDDSVLAGSRGGKRVISRRDAHRYNLPRPIDNLSDAVTVAATIRR